jgi:hypothetical protein
LSGELPLVVEKLVRRRYGQPIVRNVLRSELVEQMILDALGDGWRAAGDYEAWDVESADRACRVQVKNSAARQSWASSASGSLKRRFSIKPSRAWDELLGRRDVEVKRHATHYVFAWHSRTDADADHRDAQQWEFYIVPTVQLPATDSISITALRQMALTLDVSALARCLTDSALSTPAQRG